YMDLSIFVCGSAQITQECGFYIVIWRGTSTMVLPWCLLKHLVCCSSGRVCPRRWLKCASARAFRLKEMAPVIRDLICLDCHQLCIRQA
ncbi:hypothetical protein GGH17_006540, partial [Coemansia sp. RSA 788]